MRRSAAFLRSALPLLQGVWVVLCVLPLPCDFCSQSKSRARGHRLPRAALVLLIDEEGSLGRQGLRAAAPRVSP